MPLAPPSLLLYSFCAVERRYEGQCHRSTHFCETYVLHIIKLCLFLLRSLLVFSTSPHLHIPSTCCFAKRHDCDGAHRRRQHMQPALLQLRRKLNVSAPHVCSPLLLLQYTPLSPSSRPSFALLLGGLPSNGGGPEVTQVDRTDTVAEAPTSVNGKAHTRFQLRRL